ncbi:hypothetical protein [Aeromicrobium sp. 9AM]|uniref:hypothetical protein n=1 Tax=Aeromicrobium sp. 9AM TaxID=2653126 RepID=UPI0012F1090B|nr:hypothetical protein [Aeromicrobium sp. 9AM]VXC21160.1 conserved hypothetical protein [Aeromicrobium sp. 9AM]
MKRSNITASDAAKTVSLVAGTITASSTSRTLSGKLVIYGVVGRTNAGLLKVAPGALKFPDDLNDVILTKEHDRDDSRGHLVSLEHVDDGIRATFKVADGPEGDAALREAKDKSRRGLSFDVVDATVNGDTIVDARVIAGGQVGIPAYDGLYIDQVAASLQTPAPPTTGDRMTKAQRARLKELSAKKDLTADEQAEKAKLTDLAVADATSDDQPDDDKKDEPADDKKDEPADDKTDVKASLSGGVPPGVPTGKKKDAKSDGNAFDRFISDVTAAYREGKPQLAITAALADVTYAQHGGIIQQPAWSGELWSGVDEEPEFTNLLNAGTMTQLAGEGWRFVTKPVIQDYAGNKVAIPTTTISTERSPWVGSRMAVGNDFDRAFYDFPNEDLIRSYAEFVRKSWVMKLDAKVRDYILAHAIPAAGVPAQPTLLKAAAKIVRTLKRRNVGKATYIIANDDDYDTLMDISVNDVPAFLELFGIDPKNFIASPDVPQGTVLGGVKQAATVRTLPGSPIRVDAQHIANGGIDTAFFGYWAIEEHNDNGIATVEYEAPAEV